MSINCYFYNPEQTIFGQGVVSQLGECAGEFNAKKVFIVTDEKVKSLDAFAEVENSLKEKNIDYHVYADVDANPTDVQVQKGAEIYIQEKADILVAVGGGSSIDSAKAIGILVNNGGLIKDYHGVGLVAKAIPPLIAIPTTAGTGSEVTMWSVITNTEDVHWKMAPGGWKLLPKVALVDPVIMASMPPIITAGTGMDALSHAVEAYCSPYAMPQTDLFALEAIRLIVEHIGPATANGDDMEAREGMALGSLMAGNAFNSAGCGGIHALGHQLSSQYSMHHGMAMGMMMPYLMEFNSIACMERLGKIAAAMGENIKDLNKREAAHKAAMAVINLMKSLGLPTTLKAFGADPKLIKTCTDRASQDLDLAGNPRVPTLEQIEQIYQDAYDGALE
jgi:alcohol dehydrogenase